MTLPVRFSKFIVLDDETGCWLWTGSKRSGYGAFWNSGRVVRSHRYAYETLVGPVPEGTELDHLYEVKACVYPGHMEPVEHRTNLHRSERMRTHWWGATR